MALPEARAGEKVDIVIGAWLGFYEAGGVGYFKSDDIGVVGIGCCRFNVPEFDMDQEDSNYTCKAVEGPNCYTWPEIAVVGTFCDLDVADGCQYCFG